MSRSDRIDYTISGAIFIQSFLVVLQQFLISVVGISPDASTTYRIIMSALPMLIAILFAFNRKQLLFFKVYLFAIAIFTVHYVSYPQNTEYFGDVIKFLFPFVIPSALCLSTVKDISIAEKVLYYISWATFCLVVVYILSFILGIFSMVNYDMSFSYACLLPMASLYNRKTKVSVLASFFILIVVIGIGSRGAAVIFLGYVLYDLFRHNIRYFLLVILICVLSLPLIVNLMVSLDINSRTLMMLLSGNITSDSGRTEIYDTVISTFFNNIFGLGICGDRVILGGMYCHNIFLELILNYGPFIAFIILMISLYLLIKVFRNSDKTNKDKLIMYTFVLFSPLLVSGSYLTDINLGIYIGLIFLLNKKNKEQHIINNIKQN